ncbi:MAG: NADH-quinone oxidoreductase subunit C [Rickettsia endosymbiont of Bryobia graminum]|nr:NADH-quinone oxidoreductase subunit C [Rickettsia endosymbiont of Bryobia graminum]
MIEIIDKLIKDQKLSVIPLPLTSGILTYQSSIDSIILFLASLKNETDLRFTILTDLFGADFLDRSKRFEIVYNLLSLKLNKRILIKVEANEEDAIPSITKIFSAACWYERETYDMYGINFSGSHDVRRLLTDYGFEGHPLRKDFPLYGYVQVKYDNTQEKVVYEPVKLEQEYRHFNFSSSWEGPNYSLPGDEKAKH